MIHGSLSLLPYAKQHVTPFPVTLSGELLQWVNALNAEYAVIKMPRKILFYNKLYHKFVHIQDIKIAHGRTMMNDNRRINLVDWWLAHPEYYPEYNHYYFTPSYHHDAEYNGFNIWNGWNQPMQHSHVSYSDYVDCVEPFLYVLETWGCSGNPRDMTTLQNFISHFIQKPDEKPEHAIVLQNDIHGVRSMLMGFLEQVVGDAWIYRAHDSTSLSTHLLDRVRHSLILYAYEVSWRDKGAAERILCDIIQSPELTYKNEPEKNYTRCILASYREHHLNLSRHGDELFIPTVNRSVLPYEIKEQVGTILQSTRGVSALMRYFYQRTIE